MRSTKTKSKFEISKFKNQRFEIQNVKMSTFKFVNFQITRPGFHFGVPKKHNFATKLISYKSYGGILFQNVASGYLLHFVQDGSSKNVLQKLVLRKNIKNQKIGNKNPDQSPPHSDLGSALGSDASSRHKSCAIKGSEGGIYTALFPVF